MTGQTVTHYRILEKLGEGGMGVVFAAEDLRLKRRVALKFVSARLLEDREFRERFLREAQAAAALHHPNICTVFEMDEEHGFLAMELVAGSSLRDKIRERPLKLDEAFRLALEIAEGLKAAHAAGVVHRDVKSANVLLDGDGRAKLTDFGLATLVDSTRMTKTGTAMGTPGYLSPEQARGEAADRRTDLWALGVVLYEMVAGRLPFAGESEAAVMHALLHRQPEPLTSLRAGLPLKLDEIVAKCLAKDAGERYQHADDLLVDLRKLGGAASTRTLAVAAPAAPPRRRLWLAAGGVALLLAGSGLGVYFGKRGAPAGSSPVRRYQLAFDFDKAGVTVNENFGPAISPDGTMVTFTLEGKLYVQDLNQIAPREIAGVTGANGPFWSPDSSRVAFYTKNALSVVAATGGAVSTLGELPPQVLGDGVLGSTWSRSGTIVAGFMSLGLQEISASGGAFKPLLAPDKRKGEFDFHTPHFLPDGQTLVYSVHPVGSRRFYLCLLRDSVVRRLLEEEGGSVTAPVYSRTGHLLYVRIKSGRSVFAAPFSLDGFRLTGRPLLVAEGVGSPSVAADGTLVVKSGSWASGQQELILMGRDGRILDTVSQPHDEVMWPSFSPDGARVAVSGSDSGNLGLWVYDLARKSRDKRARLTDNNSAAWSSRGDSLFVTQLRDRKVLVEEVRLEAGGAARQVTEIPAERISSMDASRDGRYLAFSVVPAGGHEGVDSDIWICSPEEGKARPLIATRAREASPAISPDGRFIAFSSDESGRDEIHVRQLPGGQGGWAISSQGGTIPRWSQGGRELFFLDGSSLRVVAVQPGAGFQWQPARTLLDSRTGEVSLYYFSKLFSGYDVAPDGRRIVATRQSAGSRNTVMVVQNWAAELRR